VAFPGATRTGTLGATQAHGPNRSCWEGRVGRAIPLCPGSSGLDTTSRFQQSPGNKQPVPGSPTDGSHQAPGMMLEHAGPPKPSWGKPSFPCPWLCRQSCAPVAQALSPGSSLAAEAEFSIQGRVIPGARPAQAPITYETWHGHVPHCRGRFLPLASPSVFQGCFFSIPDATLEIFWGCPRQYVIDQPRRGTPAWPTSASITSPIIQPWGCSAL